MMMMVVVVMMRGKSQSQISKIQPPHFGNNANSNSTLMASIWIDQTIESIFETPFFPLFLEIYENGKCFSANKRHFLHHRCSRTSSCNSLRGVFHPIHLLVKHKALNAHHVLYFLNALGNLSKTTQRILSVRGGGGYPPFPLSFFGHNDVQFSIGYITGSYNILKQFILRF